MNRTEVRIVLMALLLVSTLIPVAAYEENIREGIYLVRPDNEFIPETPIPRYLANEDLIFFACLEQKNTPIRLSVLCLDTNEFEDVQAHRWGPENCYVGATNLERFDCTKAVVQADYISGEENLKLSQQIRINKFSETLDRVAATQLSDGGWETPLDTAYGLLVISHFPNIFSQRIEQAVEYLKLHRNENEKCWPKEGCRLSTTASILFLLEKAGFEDLRIQHDGKLYLQQTQNYLSGKDWQVTIGDHVLNLNNTVDTSCVYEYDGAVNTVTLNRYPSGVTYNLTPEYYARIGVACTENVYVTLLNEYAETRLAYQGDNFTHHIPGPCWTENNENRSCDRRTTLHAANAGLASPQRSSAMTYLSTLLVNDRIAGRHVETEWSPIDDGLYLHTQASSASMIETALLYYQNNDGGWDAGNLYYDHTYFEVSAAERAALEAEIEDNVSQDIVATGYAVMGLIENGMDREDEPLLDAERWVSLMEDETSLNYTDEDLVDAETAAAYKGNRSLILNDTKRNAMAFYVLQNNARPLLLSRPRVLEISDDAVELDIINPTIFDLEDLTYELSPEIKPHLKIEEKDYVGAYSFRRVTITRTQGTPINEIGYLRITQGDDEFLKVPVILETVPELAISLPEQVTVFGSTAILPFSIEKSDHQFSCSLQWDSEGISSSAEFNVNEVNTSTYDFPVRFAALETENSVYEGEIVCVASGVTFNIPFASNIVRFSNKPLKVQPTFLSLNGTGSQSILVQNQLDESIEVEITTVKNDPYLVVSESYLSLYPGQSTNISVQAVPPEGEGYNATNTVMFRTFNVEERVLLDITVEPPSESNIPLWARIAVLIVILGALGAAGYYGYRHREGLNKWYEKHFRKENLRERIFKQVQEMEREEELVAIKNMIRILKLQGTKEADVRNRLLKEGYTGADIDAALGEKATGATTSKAR